MAPGVVDESGVLRRTEGLVQRRVSTGTRGKVDGGFGFNLLFNFLSFTHVREVNSFFYFFSTVVLSRRKGV